MYSASSYKTKHPLWPLVNFQIPARSDNIPSTSKPNWEPKAEEFVALASSKPSYSSVSLAATAQTDPFHSPPSDQNSIHHLLRLWANKRQQRLFLAFIVSRLTAVLWLVIAPKRSSWKSQLPIRSQGGLSMFIRQVTTVVMIGGGKGRWKKKKYIKIIPLGRLWTSKEAFYTLAKSKGHQLPVSVCCGRCCFQVYLLVSDGAVLPVEQIQQGGQKEQKQQQQKNICWWTWNTEVHQ